MDNDIFRLDGKVALVTGASYGIGMAMAKALAQAGATIVFNDRKPEKVEEALAEYRRCGIDARGYIFDVTDEKAVRDHIDKIIAEVGVIDILVNNAGIIINKLVVDMTREDWERIQAVNATAAFLHCREAVKAMMPNRSGAIVNIASYASYFAFPTIAAYTASKGALAQLTRTLALEAIEHGIRVNAIGVGDVVTNILNDVVEDGPGFLAQHGEAAPIGRAAQPEEIAEVVAFLASERASFMVGSVVMADGGMTVTAG